MEYDSVKKISLSEYKSKMLDVYAQLPDTKLTTNVHVKISDIVYSDMKLDLFAGFRDDIYLIDKLNDYVNECNVSTNSGKHGHKGFVTDLLKAEEYDTVLCCGPEIMMKKVVDMCKKAGTKVYVSMEKHMACGVGACLVCTCKTKDGNKRTCKDGPVFDGNYVEL